MGNYKQVYYGKNPWKYGNGDYQDLLAMDNEPEFIVYTPDVEFYCETEEQVKQGIDEWIAENGSVEWYNRQQMQITDIPF